MGIAVRAARDPSLATSMGGRGSSIYIGRVGSDAWMTRKATTELGGRP